MSELYEHKPAEKQAEAPKSARDFPAPPAAPYAAPAAPAKKKKFPGWAIALICAAVVLLAVLVLNFAGTAVYTVLRTGERYRGSTRFDKGTRPGQSPHHCVKATAQSLRRYFRW